MSSDRLAPKQIRQEFGFRGNLLKRLRDSRHPALGRTIGHWPAVNGFLNSRADLDLINKWRSTTRPDEFQEAGVSWCSRRIAIAAPFRFPLSNLLRWSDPDGSGCPLLPDGNGTQRILERREGVIFKPKGRQQVYYFPRHELE